MQVQSWAPLTRMLKVTDAARQVTAWVCPYKAWDERPDHRLGEGPAVQLLGEMLHPSFHCPAHVRKQRWSDSVTPEPVGDVSVCECM